MFLAVFCVLLQAVTVGLTDYWTAVKAQAGSRFGSIYIYLETPDGAGTGIWVGVLVRRYFFRSPSSNSLEPPLFTNYPLKW